MTLVTKTNNPYWKPGTGNRAGTGYGGSGGYSNVVPDPSGRTDRNGNPVYIPKPQPKPEPKPKKLPQKKP